VGFGSLFVSNPDLVYRLKNDLLLTPPDKATFYEAGPKGYIDYPEAKATNG
jgi:2,4-dienoyl-CoA reductase-like NADH-dependent reductase (Old Yellow Enzyme family)